MILTYIDNYNITDMLLFSNLDIKYIIYFFIIRIFCNTCGNNIDNKLEDFNYCNVGLCNFITKNHLLFIKLNIITKSNKILTRYKYHFSKNDKKLHICELKLNNDRKVISFIKKVDKYQKLKLKLENTFKLDFNII